MTAPNDNMGRRTWAEIDLDALAGNLGLIREHVGRDVKIMAAVKADAYGHGAVECARRLQQEGVDWFGVALPEEGVELRNAGITRPILCLGGFWEGQEDICLQQNLTPVVYRLDMIESLDRAARSVGAIAGVQVKIETGVMRLGVRCDEGPGVCGALKSFPKLCVDGVIKQFPAPDEHKREEFTKEH